MGEATGPIGEADVRGREGDTGSAFLSEGYMGGQDGFSGSLSSAVSSSGGRAGRGDREEEEEESGRGESSSGEESSPGPP